MLHVSWECKEDLFRQVRTCAPRFKACTDSASAVCGMASKPHDHQCLFLDAYLGVLLFQLLDSCWSRQEVENADDIRLSTVLLRMCMGEKQVFCGDIKAGVPRLLSSPNALGAAMHGQSPAGLTLRGPQKAAAQTAKVSAQVLCPSWL